MQGPNLHLCLADALHEHEHGRGENQNVSSIVPQWLCLEPNVLLLTLPNWISISIVFVLLVEFAGTLIDRAYRY
jgi:hypothetical protein